MTAFDALMALLLACGLVLAGWLYLAVRRLRALTPAPAPDKDEIAAVAERLVRSVQREIERRNSPEQSDPKR